MSRIDSRSAVTQCDSPPRFSPLGASRSTLRQRLWACLGGLFFSAGVLAQAAAPVTPIAPQPYPSVEEAQQVADTAKADRQHALDAYQNELARCSHTFFVNHCGDKARKERDKATDTADLARQRAELFIRQVKGRERQEKLAAENADRDARDAAKHPPQQDAATPGTATPGTATPAAPHQPAAPRPPHPPAAPPAPRPVDDPAVRASNREAYERKQEDARTYAEQRAKQREQAEANRKQHREQREAEAARLKSLNPPPPANPSTAK